MKALKGITIFFAILSLMANQGFSQNRSATTPQNGSLNSQTISNPVPGKFIDNNQDGVCDNRRARMKTGRGANFVDKNGDRICDNRATAARFQRNGNCCGQGFRHRHRLGNHGGNCVGYHKPQ
jgi:hypothetical protein